MTRHIFMSSEDESIGVRKALSDERTSCFWFEGRCPVGAGHDDRGERYNRVGHDGKVAEQTDSMLLINAGNAQEPTDS